MARGNLLLGQGAGKLGDVVLYRNAGKQQARAYVTNPKNPKTYKQALQRSKFASVSLAYQYFKTIIDRSTKYSNGRTAYNEFLKNNVSIAPYASKSERQEWAGLYAFPAQWTLAYGPLSRPDIFAVQSATGTGTAISSLTFGDANVLLRNILAYAQQNNWLPLNPSDGTTFSFTAEQLAEAFAGAANCHVCIMTSGSNSVGVYNDNVAAGGVRVLELTAEILSSVVSKFTADYDGGWDLTIIETAVTINGAGGTFTIPVGASSSSTTPSPITLANISGGTQGLIYASWIGNNSGTSVQVSNVICEYAGTNIISTAEERRDPAEAQTAAAIASWQTAEVAGTDSQIY